MWKKLSFILIAIIGTQNLSAQNTDYKKNAENLRKTIWENPKSGFELREIPAHLKNESAVILSKSFESETSTQKKGKFVIIAAAVPNQTNRTRTYHERVFLNDKAALEKYSTISYQKSLNRTQRFGFTKFVNESNTFIGVKIIKPDGREVVVDTDEEVLLKNSKTDHEGKLAVPDLQVGDIIDYYVCVVEKEDEKGSLYEIEVLNEEYYTLNYYYSYTFNNKYNISLTTGNDCPNFMEEKDKDGNITYTMSGKNLPKQSGSQWVSVFRTYPYFEIIPILSTSKERSMEKGLSGKDNAARIAAYSKSKYTEDPIVKKAYVKDVKEAYKNARASYRSGKAFKSAPTDSIVSKMYDYWRFRTFCNNFGYGNYSDLTLNTCIDYRNAYSFSEVLKKNKIDHELIIVTSRLWKKLEETKNLNDVNFIIKIAGKEPSYMYFNKVHNVFNELPATVQGEEGHSIYQYYHASKEKPSFKPVKLPVIPAERNLLTEEIHVKVSEDMQKLLIDKSVSESGVLKITDQQYFLDMKLVDAQLRKKTRQKGSIEALVKKNYSKTFRERFKVSFENDLKRQDEYFTQLVKEQYDIKDARVNNKKIINSGLFNTNPELVYSSSFTLDNFVNRAGKNHLLNAGMLIGTVLPLKADERNRDIAVYMPAARKLNYNIYFQIPENYTVKGIENLNKNIKNECGEFNANSSIKDGKLIINVSRIYNNNFEKADRWPKIMDLLDAAYDFSNQKVLLEKI